jgi:hypothetical protein
MMEGQTMGPKNMHFIDEDCSKSSMGCGNCGNKTFVIFQKKGTVIVRCSECKGESILTISAHLVIDVDHAGLADGSLAPMSSDD